MMHKKINLKSLLILVVALSCCSLAVFWPQWRDVVEAEYYGPPGPPEAPGKPDNPGRPENPGKPDNPGKPGFVDPTGPPDFVQQSTSMSIGMGAETYHFKGLSAWTNFWSEDGCIHTYGNISVNENTYKGAPGAPEKTGMVWFYFYQYDYCSETPLRNIDGWADLEPNEFQTDGSLRHGYLDKTLEAYDWVSDSTIVISILTNWEGTGGLYRGNYHSHNLSGHSHSFGINREATASGMISDGTTDYVFESAFGQLSNSRGGSVYIYH